MSGKYACFFVGFAVILTIMWLTTSALIGNDDLDQNLVPTPEPNISPACQDRKTRYLIVSNELWSTHTRHIQVFLDERDFSISALQTLFSNLSDEFPEPKYLAIVVKTDWSQLDLPTDCSGSGSSGKDNNTFYPYLSARFNRDGKKKTIRYTKAKNVDRLETIELE